MQDEWGISDGYFDVGGAWHPTTDDTRAALRAAMGTPVGGSPLWFVEVGQRAGLWNPCRIRLEDGHEIDPVTELPGDLPIGYHDLIPADGGPWTRLVVSPPTCPEIPVAWGVAAQIYALWSDRSWGVGDLNDLATVAEAVHGAGGRAILVSPLHQPAPSLPQQDSPYYPSSRRAWNPLLLALDGAPPPALRCTPDSLVDRDAVWTAKREALVERHQAERSARNMPASNMPASNMPAGNMPAETGSSEVTSAAGLASDLPASASPASVACWNALCDEFGPQWRNWPDPWNRFDRTALAARLADDPEFAERALFHQWCQSRIGEQLDVVTAAGVDLIGDLAVGFSPDGADAWEYQDLLALDVRIGAPPDPFSLAGQEWGIPPFIPWRLRNAGYQPLIDTLRASLRRVQGLRIDHVMGLFRQFWIPLGRPPAEGAYVTYSADELLAIICIEATRMGAYVVGEDLGTVEPHVRERLAHRNIAGTRVLWFEDEPPSRWPDACLATVTTHDLPTVAGVFAGTDGDDEQRARLTAIAPGDTAAAVVTEVHAHLLDSPARLRLVAMDDVCGSSERPNHPGTVDRLNWRRRLPCSVGEIALPVRPPR